MPRRGLTIVELLVAIGVVAVLAAILLPALFATRGSALRLVSLTNTRTLHDALMRYAAANDETLPFPTPLALLDAGCGVRQAVGDRWDRTVWARLLSNELPWDASLDIFLSPGAVALRADGACFQPPSYAMSAALTARPAVWAVGPPIADDDPLIAPVRVDDLRFASAKTLLWDWELPYLRGVSRTADGDVVEQTPMVFGDGHAASEPPADASEPAQNRARVGGPPRRRLHDTADGAHGRDY